MGSVLFVEARHEGGMKVHLTAGDHGVDVDYPLPGKPATAPTSLELLLGALASCVANGLAMMLSKEGLTLSRLVVEASGVRRDTHPTVLEHIRLGIRMRAQGLTHERAQAAVAGAERVCPVWAMLRPGTPITVVLDVEA